MSWKAEVVMPKTKILKKEDAEIVENLDLLLEMSELQDSSSWDKFIDILLQDAEVLNEELP